MRMMKKLLTIITLIVLSASLMASEPVNLTKQETEHVNTEFKLEKSVTNSERDWIEKSWGSTVRYEKLSDGSYRENRRGEYVKIKEHDVTINTATHQYKNAGGATGLTYTVINTKKYNTQKDDLGVSYERNRAQVYFTTTTDIPQDKVLAVQFLGAEIEKGNSGTGYDPVQFKVQDYGIYLYDPITGEKGDWLSVKENNNYFGEGVGITAGTSFGVYFVDKDGNYITSTDNVIGNFDDDPHQLKTYDINGNVVYQTTDKHFLCMFTNTFESGQLNQTHWEFMLQTTLDNPYFAVNPNDFGTDVHIDNPVVNGQPLPGTLATLLIGSLCAGALRKNKKS